ncbi:MAG: hypothetical protein ACR2PI_01940 [Hyphomicrobiaceae bacterium]
MAERTYWEAFAVAKEDQARGWQLRSVTSLAKLMGEQTRYEEAKERLDPIHRSFTEGFDTLDLQRAKTVLGELGGQMPGLAT